MDYSYMESQFFLDSPRRDAVNSLDQELQQGEQIYFGLEDSTSSSDYTLTTSSSDTTSSDSSSLSPPRDEAIRDTGHSELNVAMPELLHAKKNFLVEMPPGSNRKSKVFLELLKFFKWKRNEFSYSESFNLDPATAPEINKILVATRCIEETKRLLAEFQTHLGGTQYLSNLKMTVLGHRKDYCVNEDVIGFDNKSKIAVDHACRKLILPTNSNIPSSSKRCRSEDSTCGYYPNASAGGPPMFTESGAIAHIQDIEDYKDNCRQATKCPYYATRYDTEDADIVVMPVEFLLSPIHREEYRISTSNTIVYIDDGFDLEQLCRDQTSINISIRELKQCTVLARQIQEYHQSQETQEDIGLQVLVSICSELSRTLQNCRSHFENEDSGDEDRNEHEIIMEIVHNSFSDAPFCMTLILTALREYSEVKALDLSEGDAVTIETLRKLVVILDLMSNNSNSYTVHASSKRLSSQQPLKKTTMLELICANQSLIVKEIGKNTASLIVGSNCIAPYSSFNEELFGIRFDETLKPPVQPAIRDRVLFTYTSNGYDGIKLDLTFKARKKKEVKKELGLALVDLCQTIPNGKIAVFHSEVYMGELLRFWERPLENDAGQEMGETIMDRLRNVCPVIVNELDVMEKDKAESVSQFSQASRTQSALLLCFVRGKVYRNWEMMGNESVQGVIHVSIPFGSWDVDNYIDAKRVFFEKQSGARGKEINREWYWRDAFRHINLSFGCVVRDTKDRGVVVVLDSRFYPQRHEFDDLIPDYCRQRRNSNDPRHCETVENLLEAVNVFFNRM